MRLMRMSPEERGARRTALALATAVALGSVPQVPEKNWTCPLYRAGRELTRKSGRR